MKIWYPVQGTQQLRDEYFFKIAGEPNTLAETAAIAGYFIDNAAARTALLAGGGLAVAGGYYATYYGTSEMNPDSHAVDRSVAEKAAQEYNQKLGKSVGVGLSGKF
jgi:hypothetical protein